MIVERFPFYLAYGGLQALMLSKELVRHNVRAIIVTKFSDRNRKEWLIIKEIEGVPTYAINCKSRIMLSFESYFGINLEYCLKALFLLFRLRKNYNFLHVHVLSNFHILIAVPSKLLRKKIIAKLSTFPDDDLSYVRRRRFIGSALLDILARFDGIVSINSQFTENYKKFGKFDSNKLFILPNGVDTAEFTPVSADEKTLLRRKLGLPIQKKIVSYVGWISKRKGVDVLVESWKFVVAKRKNVLLLLIGPTKNYSFLRNVKSIIESNNLEESVSFIGFVDKKRVKEFLQASDVFVFLSKNEGHPNSILEAASCGLPCVVADAPWARDTFEDKVEAYLVDGNNPEQISQSILMLIKYPSISMRLGENARMKIVNNFSIEKVANKYINVYKNILSRENCKTNNGEKP
jgi:glycosyltransferase involved in cell wall biosynthesis